MIKDGLNKISPDRRDFSFVHTFGQASPASLPANFSIYDGRTIPNQTDYDNRFDPVLPPLPMGCTGETAAFESGLQDGKLYNPEWIYRNTPPGGTGGRDMRTMLKFLINNGPAEGGADEKRKGYFNIYGVGQVTDYDAVKIALWLSQGEKRGVYVGSYFYPEFVRPVAGSGDGRKYVEADGIVPAPSFNTTIASLHCWLITGWKTIGGKEYLEGLTWQGESVGNKGVEYFSREIYNALLAQPYTAAYTISKYEKPPLPIGWVAILDHLVAYIRELFNVPVKPPTVAPQPVVEPPVAPTPVQEPTKPDTATLLGLMILAIRDFEGWYPGSRSYKNKNPGNLRYAGQAKAIGKDDKNFAVFATIEDGTNALKNLILNAAKGLSQSYKPEMTLTKFFGTYAPSNDGNFPDSYAKFVAKKMGVSTDFQLKNLA